jgi:DNA-binding winged helix-turn-helix (wHTH) protein/Tol biopolymer transport system component
MRTESDVRPFEGRKEVATLRFGPFELDLKSGELRKSGGLVRAQNQPLKVLALLASRPGEVLTREEIQREIWPDGVFVDFEQSLNFCIRHIRGVLNDSAVTPRYIETLPKRGYRWIAPVEEIRKDATLLRPVPRPSESSPATAGAVEPPIRWRGFHSILAAGGLVLAVAAGVWLLGRTPEKPLFRRLTFRRGSIRSARFATDGQTIFAASRDGLSSALFSSSQKGLGERRLEPGEGDEVVASLATGEFVFLNQRSLVRVPLSGGSPKVIAEHIETADVGPDGSDFVAIRYRSPHTQIEWPLGKVVAESIWPSHLRLSPRGDQIAFLEHPTLGDDRGYVVAVDRKGHRTQLTSEFGSAEGLAWSPKGDEIWFTAATSGTDNCLWAVSLSGRQRLVLATMGRLVIHDIAPDGRVLLGKEELRGETRFGRVGQEDQDFSWLDFTTVVDLSADGRSLVFSESGEAGGPDYDVYIRNTDSKSTPVRLGHGNPKSLSPDEKWVTTIPVRTPDRLELLPTGPGEVQTMKDGQIEQYLCAYFLPGEQSLLVSGLSHSGGRALIRTFLQPLSGPARPIAAEGTLLMTPGPSPDGKRFVARGEKGMGLFPLDGGPPQMLPEGSGKIVGWKDPETVYVLTTRTSTALIESLDLRTQRREKVQEFAPIDKAGVSNISRVVVARDGKSWAYSYARILGDLYIVDNLR